MTLSWSRRLFKVGPLSGVPSETDRILAAGGVTLFSETETLELDLDLTTTRTEVFPFLGIFLRDSGDLGLRIGGVCEGTNSEVWVAGFSSCCWGVAVERRDDGFGGLPAVNTAQKRWYLAEGFVRRGRGLKPRQASICGQRSASLPLPLHVGFQSTS